MCGNTPWQTLQRDMSKQTYTPRRSATDDFVKKLKLDITQLKEENTSLKRSQGSGGQTLGGVQGAALEEAMVELEGEVIREEEGEGAEEAPTG